jgi:serine/threonine-protein kinase ATR
MEPILFARREMLRVMDTPQSAKENCLSLIESSRLARRSGHLQTAWTFIVEARRLGIEHVAVDMEESRFLFQKGNQSQAITVLCNSLNTHFAQLTKDLEKHSKEGKGAQAKKTVDRMFVEVLFGTSGQINSGIIQAQLLLADFVQRAGAAGANDLLPKYKALEDYGERSEDFYYRYALCFDKYHGNTKELPSAIACQLIGLYTKVLQQGRSHLAHAMPRMLTLWLNHSATGTPVQPAKPAGRGRSSGVQRKEKPTSLNNPNLAITEALTKLNPYYFYTAFAQLISRITHEDPSVFQVLKHILSTLIKSFPQQCLWRSIAVYRSNKKAKCTEIYEEANRLSSGSLTNLFSDYEHIAKAFMDVADDKSKSTGKFADAFPEIGKFLSGRSTGRRPPKVLIPFIDIKQKKLPLRLPFLSQIDVSQQPQETGTYASDDIYITGIADKYQILHSLAKPKMMSLIGSDGRQYPILCKGGDEMRKDARLMDVCRVLNTLFTKDADARQRQLSIRTYIVIPLQVSLL